MKRSFLILASLLSSFVLSARPAGEEEGKQDRDSLVSLLSAQSIELIEKDGQPFRKVVGPARFFHHNTYLLCDTALWNVDRKMIHAMGNVKVLQNETELTSDSLHYDISASLAMFRGTLVQLQDKKTNTLRTNYLDYNTRDSVAVFKDGGVLRDKDGQLIESREGEYESAADVFTFRRNVEMFTDSIFIKTNELIYNAETDFVDFGDYTNAWKEENMLSAEDGWYDRAREQFFFTVRVHGLTKDREVWADSLYFNRRTHDVDMRGNVQVTDTVRRLSAVGGRLVYTDSLSEVRLCRHPVIVSLERQENGRADSVWVSADTLVYRSVARFLLGKGFVKASEDRVRNMKNDAVTAYRRKAAEEAKAAALKAAEAADPDKFEALHGRKDQKKGKEGGRRKAQADSSGTAPARGLKSGPAGSGMAAADSLAGDSLPIPAARRLKSGPAVPADTLKQGRDGTGAAADSSGIAAGILGAPADSLKHGLDSLAVSGDSLAVQAGVSKTVSDSLAVTPGSPGAAADSTGTAADSSGIAAGILEAPANGLKHGLDSLEVPADSLKPHRDSSGTAAAQGLKSVRDSSGTTAASQGLKTVRDSTRTVADSLKHGLDSLGTPADSLKHGLDSLGMAADSLGVPADSLAVAADSLRAVSPKDSVQVRFLTGIHRVKIYRDEMQVCSDSLRLNDLDSLVRLYKTPIVWDRITRQYSSDSLIIAGRNAKPTQANLISNAFIITLEDSLCFNQIRSAEMMAYFDTTGALSRFDALGDAAAILYLKEDSTFATVNKCQSKMLSARFKNEELDHVYYFQGGGSDVFPLAQMKKDDTVLKGFSWQPEKRPKSRHDLYEGRIRRPERILYGYRVQNRFTETQRYFPGYIEDVHQAVEDSRLARLRRKQAEARERARRDSLAQLPDSLGLVRDSLAVADSLHSIQDSLAVADSLASRRDSLEVRDSTTAGADSLKVPSDSLSKTDSLPKVLTKAELRAQKQQRKEERRRLKIAAREREWARLDSLDAVKRQVKAEKKAARLREKKREALYRALKQAEKDRRRLEGYMERYRKKKARLDARKAKAVKASGPAGPAKAAAPAALTAL